MVSEQLGIPGAWTLLERLSGAVLQQSKCDNVAHFYKFFSTFSGLTRKIIIFLESAHSETVEKVEKICLKWNLTPKNSNFSRNSNYHWDSVFWWPLGTFLGFHTKTVGTAHKVPKWLLFILDSLSKYGIYFGK